MLILILLVGALAAGDGSAETALAEPGSAERYAARRELERDMVECLRESGFPLIKEVVYGGSIVSYIVSYIYAGRDSDCCRIKTGFRAFDSRQQMEHRMMQINLGSVQHPHASIAMFVPGFTRTTADCKQPCPGDVADGMVAAFSSCNPRQAIPDHPGDSSQGFAVAGGTETRSLPDPLEAEWQGKPVCERLHEDPRQRVLRCTFGPGEGHERHFHGPHFGYAIAGGRMRITDQKGVRELDASTGSSFSSEGVRWHEVLNVGDTTAIYLIVEPK